MTVILEMSKKNNCRKTPAKKHPYSISQVTEISQSRPNGEITGATHVLEQLGCLLLKIFELHKRYVVVDG